MKWRKGRMEAQNVFSWQLFRATKSPILFSLHTLLATQEVSSTSMVSNTTYSSMTPNLCWNLLLTSRPIYPIPMEHSNLDTTCLKCNLSLSLSNLLLKIVTLSINHIIIDSFVQTRNLDVIINSIPVVS